MAHGTTHRRSAFGVMDAVSSIVFVLTVVLALPAIASGAATPPQDTQALQPSCDSVAALLGGAEKAKNSADEQNFLSALRTTANRGCISVILDALQSTRSSNLQETATELLVAIGDESVIAGIESVLLQNPDRGVRDRLAVIIENISAPTTATYLGQAFANSRDETLRASIPVALGRIGTEESLRQLVGLSGLLEEKDWHYVLRGFALIRNEELLLPLQRLFESGAPAPVREGVALALGNYERPEVMAAIESYLRMEPSGKVREALQVSRTRIQQGQ